MARVFLAIVLSVTLLTACSKVGSTLDPANLNGLTEVQRQEVEAWTRQAREDLKKARPFEPTDEWQEVSLNVWRMQTFDEQGNLVGETYHGETYHMEGPDAIGWVVDNVWRPKAEQLRQQLAEHDLDEAVKVQLAHQLEMFKRRIADYERIRDGIDTSACSAHGYANGYPAVSSEDYYSCY